MKAVGFDYERPTALDHALELLARDDVSARAVAGAQSLGPMLNLRLAQPDLLVDITHIAELRQIRREDGTLRIGACVTHARLEDGDYDDATRGVLPAVAAGIAYRAVRNRGTIGGSVAHADPAADWIATLTALGADVVVAGPAGRRAVPVSDFVLGVFETDLQPGEIIAEFRVPALSERARWGYYKVCRKAGEFSHATGAVLVDPARGVSRAVIAAASGRPVVVDDPEVIHGNGCRPERIADLLAGTPIGGDAFEVNTHTVALKRAIAQVTA
ncbi:FAD binding domain-containing protein [Azospirillum canadense]|uniref:FAD binding domain-containing protein n=1 Tax=Azospirillum canadense TaxID=403962 RepID=UPI0022263325|nr:FAD binding domain-containing protein [Azospirillum canadense]MCW2239387.1 carbon-monoxide dehydrogenase medium subunit [Azospirillum canadense]